VEEKRSELKAGIVISISVVLLTAMIISVSGYKFEAKRILAVEFKDIQGVKENDPVFYAGIKIGKVKKVETVTRDIVGKDGKPAKQVLARLYLEVLSEGYEIREGTTAKPVRTMTGFTMVAIRPGTGRILPPEGVTEIIGEETTTLEDLYASLQDRMLQIRDILNALKSILGKEQQQQLKDLIANARETSVRAKDLLGKLNRLADEKSAEISTTLNELRDTIRENREALKKSVQNIQQFTGKLAKLADERYDDMQQVIKNVREASERLNEILKTSGPKLASVLDGTQKFVRSGTDFINDSKRLLDENRENLEAILINVRDTTANLQAMSEDLRQHPWLLLNRPTDEELMAREAAETSKALSDACDKLNGCIEKLAAIKDEAQLEKEAGDIISEIRNILNLIKRNQEEVKRLLPAKK